MLMKHLALIAATAISLLLASTATAGTLLVDQNDHPVGGEWQAWVDHAYVPTPPGKVTLIFAPIPYWGASASGCAYPDRIYIDPSALSRQPSALWPYVLLHELGHVYDYRVLTDTQRVRFMALWNRTRPGMSVHDAWWYGSNDPTASRPVDEWFAEAYRIAALNRTWSQKVAVTQREWLYWYPAMYGTGLDPKTGHPVAAGFRDWALMTQWATVLMIRNGQ